ncbi:MAG: RagB/SusD family nutrient uptake outer membrane protein [Rikenellaceae bacterium]
MKIFNKIKNGSILAIAMLASSCMELQPLSSLGDEYVWTSASNFQLFANQFYAWDRGFNQFLGDNSYSELRADMAASYASANTYSQGLHTVPNTDSQYGTCYQRIYYCNLLLENAADYSDQDAISTPMGEAYFYRAMMHFELARLYGDAIILTETLDLTSEKLYATQDNRDDVIDQVVKDLQKAAELLPATSTEKGLLNRYMAYANLARIALWEGTWEKFHNHCSGGAEDANGNFSYENFGKYSVEDSISNTTRSTTYLTLAKEAALEVMNSGKYELFYSDVLGSDSYRCMFFLDDSAQCNIANLGTADNKEYIQVDRIKTTDETSFSITHSLLNNAWVVTRKMADMYLDINGLPISESMDRSGYTSEFTNRDPRMAMSLIVRSQQYWGIGEGISRIYWTDDDYEFIQTKTNCDYTGYWNRKWGAERRADNGTESQDFPLIRYAEILLTYAEACFELNGSITDAELAQSLNLIRARVSMPDLTNTFVTNNQLCMREEIRRERTVELYGEALRLDDIRRWAVGSTEMPGDLMGVQYTGTIYASNWASTASVDANGDVIFRSGRVWYDSRHYLYPLPADELELNPNLRQNAGWDY